MEKIIIPAIIAISQEELDERINKVKDHAEFLQLDVMDGMFVPSHSLDFDFKLPEIDCKFEAHLMVNNPEEWIEMNYSKVDTILAHFESCKNPEKVIGLIRNKGKKVGLVINPETSVQDIEEFLDNIDQVLVMTVNPGFYGAKFLQENLSKVKELRQLKPDLAIEVDGGVSIDTIKTLNEAGANLFVCGSYLQKSEDVALAIEKLKNLISST